MNNVKASLFTKFFQLVISSEAKCQRLDKHSLAGGAYFIQVNRVPYFGEIGSQRAFWMIHAQAFEAMQDYSFAYLRKGWTGYHLHFVPHPLELTCQVININTLPTAVGIPPVGQKADSHIYLGDTLRPGKYSMFVEFAYLGAQASASKFNLWRLAFWS